MLYQPYYFLLLLLLLLCNATFLRLFSTPPALKHEDFEVIEIEEECDPPAFTRARKEDTVKDARSPKDDEENEIAKEMAEALGSAEVRQVEANPGPLVQQVRKLSVVCKISLNVTGPTGYRPRPERLHRSER